MWWRWAPIRCGGSGSPWSGLWAVGCGRRQRGRRCERPAWARCWCPRGRLPPRTVCGWPGSGQTAACAEWTCGWLATPRTQACAARCSAPAAPAAWRARHTAPPQRACWRWPPGGRRKGPAQVDNPVRPLAVPRGRPRRARCDRPRPGVSDGARPVGSARTAAVAVWSGQAGRRGCAGEIWAEQDGGRAGRAARCGHDGWWAAAVVCRVGP